MSNYRILFVMFVTLAASFAAAAEKNLVFYSSLDTAQYLAVPQVGKPAIVAREVTFVEGVKGGAIRVKEGAGSVAFPLPEGLPPDCGMIEFDAKIENDRDWYRDAGDPTFFSIFDEETSKKMLMAFEINANNGIAKSGWYLRMSHYGWTTSLPNFGWHIPYKTCFGEDDPKAWHHYAIRWNIDGLDGSSDTVRVTRNGAQILSMQKVPENLEKYRARMCEPARLYFAREFFEKGQNHCDYLIDEFKIWSTDTPTRAALAEKKAKQKKTAIKLTVSPELAAARQKAKEAAALAAKKALLSSIPQWSFGEFFGGGEKGAAAFLINDSGRLEGTYQTVDKTWKLVAEEFKSFEAQSGLCVMDVSFVTDGEKMVKPLFITIDGARCEDFEAWMCEWKISPAWKAVAEKLMDKTCTLEEENAVVRVEIDENAQVRATYVSEDQVSKTSSTLIPVVGTESEYHAYLCFPKDEKKKFPGCVTEVTVDASDF